MKLAMALDAIATFFLTIIAYPVLLISILLITVLLRKKYTRKQGGEHAGFYIAMINVSVCYDCKAKESVSLFRWATL